MVNKITTPPTQNEVIDKINELVDDKQDVITSSNKLPASLVSGLATVATSGSYNDLSNKPTIPTVNNATLTIQKNGSNVATFTANASSNVTANIEVPTNNNQLTNGAGYITGIPYGESTSAADAVQKEVTISEITELKTGQIIIVKPTITSTVANATLKLNSFAAYPMLYGAAAITTSTDSITWAANYPSWFRFDGSHWVFLGHGVDNNTTYSTMSVSEGTTGTATSNRSLQARYLKQIIQGTTLTGISTSTTGAVTASDTITTGIGKLQATKADKSAIPTVGNGTITINQGGTARGTFTTNQNTNLTIDLDGTSGVSAIAILNKNTSSPYQTLGIWQGTEQQWTNGELKTWYYWQTNFTATWTASATLPSSGSWQTPAYGNGNFVTVGSGSDISAYSTDGGVTWNSATLPSSLYWASPAYGNGNFVTVAYSSTSAAYSTDGGVTWNSARLPRIGNWRTPAYGDGVFVTVAYGSTSAAYSTDGGVTWNSATLPSSGSWQTPAYGNGNFVTVAYSSNISAYSTDGGVTWNSAALPRSGSWQIPAYGDGVFVTVAYGSNISAYSTDGGVTWNSARLPRSGNWKTPAYGDGVFVTVAGDSTSAAYSTDGGVTWNSATLPRSGNWLSPAYGNGVFVIVESGSDISAYSTDGGVTWNSATLPSSVYWASPAYGNGVFVIVGYDSDISAIFSVTYDKCYTDTANPTTTSVVYSAPETASALTVSSVTSGAITLSNNNTYYYNQSGNQYTYDTIGNSHPEYLCFINGVGVKIGNTTIATNNSNNS